MTVLTQIYDDPTFFGSGPGFVNRTQSDPGFVNPVRSGPIRSWFCQSDPIRFDPGFVNTLFKLIYSGDDHVVISCTLEFFFQFVARFSSVRRALGIAMLLGSCRSPIVAVPPFSPVPDVPLVTASEG